jgi:acyl-CoA thioesterase FadM
MAKQRMIVSDDQLLVDFELIFKAIRQEKGNWKKVEKELKDWLSAVQGMVEEK